MKNFKPVIDHNDLYDLDLTSKFSNNKNAPVFI